MKYSEYRSNIKSGDLIAYTHYGWANWYDLQVQAVRIFTESEYTHVGLVLELGGRLFLLESVVPVIRLVPLSNSIDKNGFYHLPMHTDINNEELEFSLSKLGRGKYSKIEAILAQFRKIKIGANDLWECAEYVIACRRLSGVDLGDVATPAEVVRSALKLGKEMRLILPD
jgi:hypothetical protein